MGGLDYAMLREIQRKELASPKLGSLSSDFYVSVADFLNERKCEAFSSNSVMKIREYENLQKIVFSIKEKREEKILLMALRGEKVNGELTSEERELFNRLTALLRNFRGQVDKTAAAACEVDDLKVKVIKDIEAYKGLDGNVYGPYKKDEIMSLPKAEVDWLVKAKMAEMLVIQQ
ncbi:MAG: hypothetical protein V1492_04760 [Candidatus Micrarchaeota archaeon]